MSTGATRGFAAITRTLFLGVLVPALAIAASTAGGFVEHHITVDGTRIHLTIGGSGPPVVLLHSYAEISRMWKPLASILAAHFTVIMPDLPGIRRTSRSLC